MLISAQHGDRKSKKQLSSVGAILLDGLTHEIIHLDLIWHGAESGGSKCWRLNFVGVNWGRVLPPS